MVETTKEMFCVLEACVRQIELFATPFASCCRSSTPRFKSTFMRTMSFARTKCRLKNLTTNFTGTRFASGGNSFAFARAVCTCAFCAITSAWKKFKRFTTNRADSNFTRLPTLRNFGWFMSAPCAALDGTKALCFLAILAQEFFPAPFTDTRSGFIRHSG